MTNTDLLNDKIKQSGLKKSLLIGALGLSYTGFRNKAENKSGFLADEIMALCKLLKIGRKEKDLIFFARNVDKKTTS